MNMEILQAIILGIVEGLTEFLPISSTGHLIVTQDALGFYDASKMFMVVVQMGAIAAVMWFYRRQLRLLVRGLVRRDPSVSRFWLLWTAATLPAGIAGLLFDTRIEAIAATTVVAAALVIGGVIMWLIETYARVPASKDKEQFQTLSPKKALAIGAYQMLALIPGVSRSGATIMGALTLGVDRVTATAFSFYLGIPVLLLAGVYKLLTEDTSSIAGGAPALLAGTLAAFCTALAVVGWLLRYVSRNTFKPFAYYRIAFGLLLFVLLAAGVLD